MRKRNISRTFTSKLQLDPDTSEVSSDLEVVAKNMSIINGIEYID
jgi:hypothetical protein